jgi:hypothetical protein
MTSVAGWMEMMSSFGYDLIYFDMAAAVFVDSRALLPTPGERELLSDDEKELLEKGRWMLSRYKNDIYSLCHQLKITSQRYFKFFQISGEDSCRYFELKGYEREELEAKYHMNRNFTAAEFWDAEVQI